MYKSHLLRKGRVSLPFHYYSVTCVCRDRSPVFTSFNIAQLVINELYRFDLDNELRTICYMLMPDHLHWLFQLGDHLKLSEVVNRLKGRTIVALREHGLCKRSIWQKGFYDHCLRDDQELLFHARYIAANPLRAKLVSSIGDYPFWNCVYLDGALERGYG